MQPITINSKKENANETQSPIPVVKTETQSPAVPTDTKTPTQNGGQTAPNPIRINIAARTDPTINGLGTNKTADQNVSIQQRAKMFAPSIGTVISLFDGALLRLVRGKCRKVCGEDETESITSGLTRSNENKKAFQESLSRIIAKRTDNEEVLDWVVVGTGIGDTVIGLADVLGELRKISDQNKKILALQDKTPDAQRI